LIGLKLRGLPFQIKVKDIQTFFSGYNCIPSSIILGKNQEGRANGLASVLFLTEDDCKRAMFEKQG
jgi:RNA recognition motif-containing protein